MTRLARAERAALCDLALQVGEDRPTLCEGWTVKDLVVHLLVRERSPAAVGIVVAPAAPLTDLVSRRVARRPFAELVERLRGGPPPWSPMALPKVDDLVNTLEFFVHLEDVRRAQPGWTPRPLDDATERRLWSALRVGGRGPLRGTTVGVVAQDVATGSTAVLAKGDPSVTLRGLPSELTLYAFGRTEQADVEVLGDPDAVARLDHDVLGI
jgi:uncharacterized protein (TIGR03085 family)